MDGEDVQDKYKTNKLTLNITRKWNAELILPFLKAYLPTSSMLLTLQIQSLIRLTLFAAAMNGASCTGEGLAFDGVDDYAVITPNWRWGGTTSFEVLIKYRNFNFGSSLFEFGNGAGSDSVFLENQGASSIISWQICKGSSSKDLRTSNFESSAWTHVVVTVKGTTMKVYKNGDLVGTKSDIHEPNVMTRTQHWLGRSAYSFDGYFDGTIAYLKMWHGVELTEVS